MASTSKLGGSEDHIQGTTPPQMVAHHDEECQDAEAPSSGARLVGIPELLEQILETVDLKDLFVLSRVKHTFKNVILGSTKLQRKAYLATGPGLESVRSLQEYNPCWENVEEMLDFEGITASFTPAERCGPGGRWKLDTLPPGALEELTFRITVPQPRKCVVAGPSPRIWRAVRGKVGGTTGPSWARMHMTPYPLRFRIHFSVLFPDEEVYHQWLDCWLPDERDRLTHELEPGKATLGALHDVSIEALETLAAKFIEWDPDVRSGAEETPG